jgi:hypothetical protein
MLKAIMPVPGGLSIIILPSIATSSILIGSCHRSFTFLCLTCQHKISSEFNSQQPVNLVANRLSDYKQFLQAPAFCLQNPMKSNSLITRHLSSLLNSFSL